MKKTVICSVPMRERIDKTVYSSNGLTEHISKEPYYYPINSMLSAMIQETDELKIILLIKKDSHLFYEKNKELFVEEIKGLCNKTKAKAEFVYIDTDFSQNKETHETLMSRIIDEIEDGAHILVDVTYGPKDLPIVIFTALYFAEKFLECEIDNIVYGKADFENNRVVNAEICDMMPLYCLSSVTNIIKCDEPDDAREMLKTLLSL